MPATERRIDEWVTAAWDRTTLVPIDDPEGFVAECDAAPGALAFGRTVEEAREEMRTVLLDWATLRMERGHTLPLIRGAVAASR